MEINRYFKTKDGLHYKKVIKEPVVIHHQDIFTGFSRMNSSGDWEIIILECGNKEDLVSIAKHYIDYEFVNIPVTKEEFDTKYNECLNIINEFNKKI